MKWEFKDYKDKWEVSFDPGREKSFRDQELAESLIREFIQNSLDAKEDDIAQPVEVAIYEHILKEKIKGRYLEKLKDHLHAVKKDRELKNECRMITLEDFNTTGLKDKNFDDFFLKDNITSKNRGGGSHGIGKAVFNNSSKIRTFFAYSLFKDKKNIIKDVFHGKSVLRTHEIEDKKFYPYGIGIPDSKKICKEPFVKNFFKRSQQKKTGLSIAIPYCSIKMEDLKKFCIDQCYMPIYEEKLKVNINNNEIDRDELIKHCEQQMVNMLLEWKTSKLETIEEKFLFSQWESLDDSHKLFKEIREISEKGEKLFCIDIEIEIPKMKNKKSHKKGSFRIIIQKNDDQDSAGKVDFWRDDVLISKALERTPFPKGFLAIAKLQTIEPPPVADH